MRNWYGDEVENPKMCVWLSNEADHPFLVERIIEILCYFVDMNSITKLLFIVCQYDVLCSTEQLVISLSRIYIVR
jgi:hypothetical protein